MKLVNKKIYIKSRNYTWFSTKQNLFILNSLMISLLLCSCSNKIGSLIKSEKNTNISGPLIQNTKNAEKYMEVYDLGGRITTHANFIELLSHLPTGKKDSRMYLVRTDNFSIGENYQKLDKWDVALESGYVDGLLGKEIIITEKLDHIKPRNPKEFINTIPMDAFYMHGIDLKDLELIKNNFNSTTLMNYQIIDFSDKDLSLTVYVRIVDIETMKIISSGLIQVEEPSNIEAKKEIDAFKDAYEIIKNISDFPSAIFNEGVNLGVINADLLNIKGNYKEKLSEKTISIENGIITGLIYNEKYDDNEPIVMEKSEGFKLKFPSVYKNILFNTSPILYEEWSEFRDETKCNMLLTYRFLPDNGIYLKVIDVNAKGKIIYSKAFSFNGREDNGLIANHDFIAEQFLSGFDFEIFNNRKILIMDGNHQSVESKKYLKNLPSFNAMNLAIEDGIVSALVSQNIDTFEKLKTLYLKRPWMYERKVFNLNPLYLESWNQLKEFGVETLIMYQNLIPYEKLKSNDPEYTDVAISVKVIDIETGDIIALSGITNID
jgi:hypothetical protein